MGSPEIGTLPPARTREGRRGLFEILQTIAKHVGIVNLNGLSIGDFFDRRRCEIAENLIADSADRFPALASQMKFAWKKLDREQSR
jgi:hypothetical protein